MLVEDPCLIEFRFEEQPQVIRSNNEELDLQISKEILTEFQ